MEWYYSAAYDEVVSSRFVGEGRFEAYLLFAFAEAAASLQLKPLFGFKETPPFEEPFTEPFMEPLSELLMEPFMEPF